MWVNAWVAGWLAEWMGGWMGGWVSVWVDEWVDGEWMDGQMNSYSDVGTGGESKPVAEGAWSQLIRQRHTTLPLLAVLAPPQEVTQTERVAGGLY